MAEQAQAHRTLATPTTCPVLSGTAWHLLLPGAHSVVFPVELKGDRIVLREITLDDLDAALIFAADPDVTRHLPFEPQSAAEHDAMVRAALARHRGREVKTIGDGFLATFDGTGRAIRCAAEILASAKDLGLELRAGVHIGEVEQRGDDIAGLAVNIAKRVCDLAGPGEVLVSESVRLATVGSGIEFADRGEHELKGVPGLWRLYGVAA
jgi:hypothetical protein